MFACTFLIFQSALKKISGKGKDNKRDTCILHVQWPCNLKGSKISHHEVDAKKPPTEHRLKYTCGTLLPFSSSLPTPPFITVVV